IVGKNKYARCTKPACLVADSTKQPSANSASLVVIRYGDIVDKDLSTLVRGHGQHVCRQPAHRAARDRRGEHHDPGAAQQFVEVGVRQTITLLAEDIGQQVEGHPGQLAVPSTQSANLNVVGLRHAREHNGSALARGRTFWGAELACTRSLTHRRETLTGCY